MKACLPLLLLCAGLLLVAGCSSPVVTPVATPTPSPLMTPSPTLTEIPVSPLLPQPTDVIPPFQQVAIQITKNTVATDPWVSVLFAGGSGQSFASMMTATIIRVDGTSETASVRSPEIGSNLLLSGSTRTDRVIVNITYTDGNTYTVKDELVPFQSPNT